MKNLRFLVFTGFIFFAVTALLCCTASHRTEKTPKAVFIIIDGVPADVIEKLHPSTLDGISKVGGYTRAYVGGRKTTYNETPTISAPGYISLLTGTWGNKHNVWDNDIAMPNYNYWNIFRIVEKRNPDLHTAVFSTWLDNRTKLIGEGLDQAGAITLDYKFDGLEHDTIKYPMTKQPTTLAKLMKRSHRKLHVTSLRRGQISHGYILNIQMTWGTVLVIARNFTRLLKTQTVNSKISGMQLNSGKRSTMRIGFLSSQQIMVVMLKLGTIMEDNPIVNVRHGLPPIANNSMIVLNNHRES